MEGFVTPHATLEDITSFKLEAVTTFKYLGSVITDEGSTPEITPE